MNTKYLYLVLAIWIFAAVPMGFADTFLSRPTLAEMDEAVEKGTEYGHGVRERDLAVDDDQSFLPYCGIRASYFASLQQELEILATQYIDHVSGPLVVAETNFRYFTLATWRAEAGLNASGFRRSTNGTTYVYGIAQAGDLMGEWIFEDLQKGGLALQWLPFFPRIVPLRSLFPAQIEGEGQYTASGTAPDPDDFGVFYSYPTNDLGGSGCYTNTLDNRTTAGASAEWYITLGASSDKGHFILDAGISENDYNYEASLTFLDGSSLVEVGGIYCFTYSGSTPDSSCSLNTVNVSALLEGAGQGVAEFYFFPYVKVPFVYMTP